jgi:hypothetical protein
LCLVKRAKTLNFFSAKVNEALKPVIVHNDKSVDGNFRQFCRQPDNNFEHQGKLARKGQIREMQIMEMQYVYEMLVELRKVAKEADETSLVYYTQTPE